MLHGWHIDQHASLGVPTRGVQGGICASLPPFNPGFKPLFGQKHAGITGNNRE